MAFGKLSLKGRALRSLAQREHSRAELQAKLARHLQATDEPQPEALIAKTLDDLAHSGLLSDTRTAESVLRSQGQRYGSLRLKHTLQAKGLDAELVASTVASARSTDLQRAQDLWRRRFGTPPVEAKERLRQMRFLAQRGFDGATVGRVMRGACADKGIPGDTVDSVDAGDTVHVGGRPDPLT